MLETHPLFHRTFPITTSPWQVHTHVKMPLYYPVVGRRIESVIGVHEYQRGFVRSISECVMCLPVRYHCAILLIVWCIPEVAASQKVRIQIRNISLLKQIYICYFMNAAVHHALKPVVAEVRVRLSGIQTKQPF